MDQEILEALNKQLNQELRNAYFYLAMAAHFDHTSLSGFAHYFKVQAREELEHAMKIYEYVNARGARVELQDVTVAKKEWNSVLEAVRDFYEAERANTQRIWNLVDLARRHGDKATEAFLQWFVNEQVEEEEQALDLLNKVEMIKDNVAALLALDKVLSERK
ncbi:MAG: ferritin [Desulfurococcaceae archaeon]